MVLSVLTTGKVSGKPRTVDQNFFFEFGASVPLVQEKNVQSALLFSKTFRKLRYIGIINSVASTKNSQETNIRKGRAVVGW